MKLFTLVLMILLGPFFGVSQSLSIYSQEFGVKKKNNSGRELLFKPGKRLTLTTSTGLVLTGKDYYFTQDQILLRQESILIQDIAFIRGKVERDHGRKVLGYAMVAGGLLMGWNVQSFSNWAARHSGGPPSVGYSLPFFGIAAAGVILLGSRGFNTRKWEVQLPDSLGHYPIRE